MKNIITGISAFLILLLLIMTIYTIQGKTVRQEEIQDGIDTALKTAGEELKEAEAYASDEELKGAFVEHLMLQMDSASDVDVTILGADHEKGVISAEVAETYTHPNGKEGKASGKRTIILDRKKEETEKGSHNVKFYLDSTQTEETLYKTATLKEGEPLTEPQEPEGEEGKQFAGWKDAGTGQMAVFGAGILEETILYAVWR